MAAWRWVEHMLRSYPDPLLPLHTPCCSYLFLFLDEIGALPARVGSQQACSRHGCCSSLGLSPS